MVDFGQLEQEFGCAIVGITCHGAGPWSHLATRDHKPLLEVRRPYVPSVGALFGEVFYTHFDIARVPKGHDA